MCGYCSAPVHREWHLSHGPLLLRGSVLFVYSGVPGPGAVAQQSDERASLSYSMMTSFRCIVVPAAGGAIILCGFCPLTYCVQEQYTVVLGRHALLLRPPLGPTGSGSTAACGGPDLTGRDHDRPRRDAPCLTQQVRSAGGPVAPQPIGTNVHGDSISL